MVRKLSFYGISIGFSYGLSENNFDFDNQNRNLVLPLVTCCKSGGREINEHNVNNS